MLAGNAQIWTFDAAGEPTRGGSFIVEPPALGIAFSADRSLVAVSSESCNVHLYNIDDPANPAPLAVIKAGESFAISVAFHPRMPDRLAAGLTDGNVWIWNTESVDAVTVQARVPFRGSGVTALAFSSDDRHLFGAGPHHRICHWILDESLAVGAIKNAVGDAITAEEWSRLVPALPYAPPV